MKKLIFLAVCVALASWVVSPMVTLNKEKQELERLQTKLATIKRENQRLRGELSKFDDPAFIEVLAREKLGLVRKGERAFVVVSERYSSAGNATKDAGRTATGDSKAVTADKEAAGSRQGTIDKVLGFLGLGPEEER